MAIDTTAPAMGLGAKPLCLEINMEEPKCSALPAEILHRIMDELHLDDLHKCRLVSSQWNDVAMEHLRGFAVLNRRSLQRRWDPSSAGLQARRLWRPRPGQPTMYWLDTNHPAQSVNPPVKEVSIGLHHPEECAAFHKTYVDGPPPKLGAECGLPPHLPALKITLQGSPLFENFWRIEDDPEGTPFAKPEPIYGYKVANPHGERIGVPSRQAYTDGAEAVRPDDLTVQFTHCGFSDTVGKQVDTICTLVLYNVPFMHGEVSDAVYDCLHHKAAEMVWVLTYPGRCKLGEHCNDIGQCGDHANEVVDYKVRDLLRIIPTRKDSRLRRVTVVFKPKDPSMKWDRGCHHSGRRGAWWAEELLGNLAHELARPEYAHVSFEFVNLECLSLNKTWRPGRDIPPPLRRKYVPPYLMGGASVSESTEHSPHAELDVVMRKAHFDALADNPDVTLKDLPARTKQLGFSTMQDWVQSGGSYGILSERETIRWKEFWRLGPEVYHHHYGSQHDYYTSEHHYFPAEMKRKLGDDLDYDSDTDSDSDPESDF